MPFADSTPARHIDAHGRKARMARATFPALEATGKDQRPGAPSLGTSDQSKLFAHAAVFGTKAVDQHAAAPANACKKLTRCDAGSHAAGLLRRAGQLPADYRRLRRRENCTHSPVCTRPMTCADLRAMRFDEERDRPAPKGGNASRISTARLDRQIIADSADRRRDPIHRPCLRGGRAHHRFE